ncbi:hypothetical protein ACFX2J_025326 [Malus domestica]
MSFQEILKVDNNQIDDMVLLDSLKDSMEIEMALLEVTLLKEKYTSTVSFSKRQWMIQWSYIQLKAKVLMEAMEKILETTQVVLQIEIMEVLMDHLLEIKMDLYGVHRMERAEGAQPPATINAMTAQASPDCNTSQDKATKTILMRGKSNGGLYYIPKQLFFKDFGLARLKIEAEGEEGWDDRGKRLSCPSQATLSSLLCPLTRNHGYQLTDFAANGS